MCFQTYHSFSEEIKCFVNEVYFDSIENVIGHQFGNGKKLMLIAHRDVVSLMITHIDENGFLFVKPARYIDPSILPARSVMIKHSGNNIIGIIGKKPVHLLEGEQNNKVSFNNLWIDIGAKSKSEALRMVEIGDYAYFSSELEYMPNDYITGAYIDDRVGLFVLRKLAEHFNKITVPWDIYFVASNHEEIGMRGAVVAANSIKPDICICIDVTHATDYPTMNAISDGDIKLGEGCVLAKGPNSYPALYKKLKHLADKHKISYQIEVSPYATGTDANIIQLCGEGIKTAIVSIPCRYMHTPYEMCSRADIDSAFKLVEKFILAGNVG